MNNKDHDTVIGLSKTQDIMCKKLDYIRERVDAGFEKNDTAHGELIKYINDKVDSKVPYKVFISGMSILFILACGAYSYAYLLSSVIR